MRTLVSNQRGFTLFGLLCFFGAIIGAIIGYKYGFFRFGPTYSVACSLAGGVIGYTVFRLPYLFVDRRIQYILKNETSQQLRDRLYIKDQYFIILLILTQLINRHENINNELSFVIGLIRSDSIDRRRFGWAALNFAYPKIAIQIAEYQPTDRTEKCRTLASRINFEL